MRRIHLGIVPESLLDSEAKVIAWSRQKTKAKGVEPLELVLSVSRTYAEKRYEERKTRKLITICEALCDTTAENTVVTYHETTPYYEEEA